MKTNHTAKQDAIICLAAGKSQEALLTKAKSLGYTIVAVDKNPEALGFKFADISVCESTYDAKAIIFQLELLDSKYRWVGVLNRSSGPPVSVAAELCEYFDLPGVPVDAAKTLVNKDQLRSACTKFSVPTPEYEIRDITDAAEEKAIQYPVVVKPALSLVGKSGITVVLSHEEFVEAFEYAKEKTINGKVLIEEYLPGPDLTLVSFFVDGKICPICLLDELNVELNGKVTSRGYKVSNKSDLLSEAILISQKLADVFGIKRSPFMASFRMAEDGSLRLIEVHLDLGGDLLMEEVFPRALSFDFKELAVRMSAGDGSCPNVDSITPTAIFYERGEALLNERGFQVFTAESHQMLSKKIMEAGV